MALGRERASRKDWDAALEFFEKALAEDPADPGYQLETNKTRFQAGSEHVHQGIILRKKGMLAQALVEFEHAYRIDPSSTVAEQEIQTTQEMIVREKKKGENSETRGLTPADYARKESEDRIDSMLPMPDLKPLNSQPINLKMNNQPPKVLFETVGKLAGINVLFDPEYSAPGGAKNQSIELTGATLIQALDYVSLITKSFWKPLSSNAIFVTQDNTTKRRDYEEQVMKVFYLTNPTTPQELQEIVTAVRSVADIQRLFVYNAQNAIIARGEADRIALAEKIIHDLDKPKSEVIVDVLVLQVSSDVTRTLGAGIGGNGLNLPVTYTPRSTIVTPTSTNSTTGTATGTGTGAVGTTGTGTTTTTSATSSIPLAYIGKTNWADFSTVLPGANLQAVLSDSSTRVLQSPEIRSVDNQKATLKVGEKEPIASGSFQPGIGGVGINPLVNTQFTFIDVGVNVDLTPKVHDNGEISMHVEVEISSVVGNVNLGGIQQPIISQEKVIHDIRMRDGEINLLGGLKQSQESNTLTGIPGLSSIPVIKYLFSTKTVNKSAQELLIALIPHIVRRPDYTEENLRGVSVGNATTVKLNYAPPPPPQDGASGMAVPVPAGAAPASAPAMPAGTNNPATPVTPVNPGGPMIPAAPNAPPAATPPGRGTALNFVPNSTEVALNGQFKVNLTVQNAPDLFSAPMTIKFDPKVLRLTEVVQGNLLSSDGKQVAFTKNVQNDTGEATINLNRFPGSGGVTSAGTLVTLSFTAIGPGDTTVRVQGFNPTNSQGQPLPGASPAMPVKVK